MSYIRHINKFYLFIFKYLNIEFRDAERHF